VFGFDDCVKESQTCFLFSGLSLIQQTSTVKISHVSEQPELTSAIRLKKSTKHCDDTSAALILPARRTFARCSAVLRIPFATESKRSANSRLLMLVAIMARHFCSSRKTLANRVSWYVFQSVKKKKRTNICLY
jgi:hypothetical protein